MSENVTILEAENRKVLLSEYLTTEEVCQMFGITKMTAYKWRKELGMPYCALDGETRPPIRYVIRDVLKWAKKHDKEVVVIPERTQDNKQWKKASPVYA